MEKLRSNINTFFKRKATGELGSGLVSGSFASSGAILERVAGWSGSHDRNRPFVMKFHKQWGHNSCPVMDWYKQQTVSSTLFRSVEHHRGTDAPFFHEFLLLKLTDGAICRVERTGEGSRADAIRYIGCAAHDLIQWRTLEDYSEFSAKHPSVMLAKVDLGQDFDLLDVLAVCYSIQNARGCRVYTLQRYNCYFLCLTILAALTRRVAIWENIITTSTWEASVGAALDSFLNHPTAELKRHPAFRICSILDPKGSQPEKVIVDSIRAKLISQAGADTNLKRSLGTTLWWSSCGPALYNGLTDATSSSASALFAAKSCTFTSNLRHAIFMEHESAEKSIEARGFLSQVYYKQLFVQVTHYCDQHRKAIASINHMIEMEQPASFVRLALHNFSTPWTVAIAGMHPNRLLEALPRDRGASFFWSGVAIRHWSIPARLSAARLVSSLQGAKAMEELHGGGANEEFQLNRAYGLVNFMAQMFDALDENGLLDSSGVWLVIASQLSEKGFADILNALMYSSLYSAIRATLEAQQPRIHVEITPQGRSDINCPDVVNVVSDFQESYIKSRIYAHAQRVAAHQLAAAPLVREDIEKTMAEVWRSIPATKPGSSARDGM